MEEFYKRRLPHIQPKGATLFVTFRLAGSLLREVIEQLQTEYEAQKAAATTDKMQYDAAKRHTARQCNHLLHRKGRFW